MDQPQRQPDPSLDQQPNSLLTEFAAFLRHNMLWWIVPMLLVVALFIVLIAISGTSTTPFIYSAN
jgi:hypothetical protein